MSEQRGEFEDAYTLLLMQEGVSLETACLYFERGSDGEYRSVRVKGAWWGWNNNPDIKRVWDEREYYFKEANRLREACEKEFQSVEQLNDEVQRLKAELASLKCDGNLNKS